MLLFEDAFSTYNCRPAALLGTSNCICVLVTFDGVTFNAPMTILLSFVKPTPFVRYRKLQPQDL